MKTITIFPFVISVSIVGEQGITLIALEFYKGKESNKWTMSFTFCDFMLLISII